MTETTITAPIKAPLPRALEALAAELKADLPLLAVMAAYIGVVTVLCYGLQRPEFYHPDIYMGAWGPTLVTALGLYVMVIELPQAILENPKSPVSAFVARLRRFGGARFVAGTILFFAAGFFTGAFTSAKSLINDLVPFHADAALADFDAALHFGVDPWRLLQPLLGHHEVTRALQNLYLTGWGMMLMGFTAIAAYAPKLAGVRRRYFLTFFASWIVLGNLMAAAFMSGGPVYYGPITGDEARFAEQMRYLAFSDNLVHSSYELQQILWTLYERGQVHVGTGISAFPSLHVAMATLFALLAGEIDRRLGWIVSAVAVAVLAATVHLAWHYAIDGYVSAAFVLAVWFGLKRLEARPAA